MNSDGGSGYDNSILKPISDNFSVDYHEQERNYDSDDLSIIETVFEIYGPGLSYFPHLTWKKSSSTTKPSKALKSRLFAMKRSVIFLPGAIASTKSSTALPGSNRDLRQFTWRQSSRHQQRRRKQLDRKKPRWERHLLST